MVDGRKTRSWPTPCGIIRVTALCDLCRYRHNGHATGHGSRLDRQFGKRFGDDAYAAEELLAGLAQSILCAEYGLPNELHDSHASYIHHWAKILRADKTAILHAAAKAEQAVKWLRQFDPALIESVREAA